MKKINLILVALFFIGACANKEKTYLINKKQVGKITTETKVKDLNKIFAKDSIVKNTEGESAFESYDEYTVFDKKTKEPLLLIIPNKTKDENALIKQVEILSPKYNTYKGINLQSSFGQIKKAHKIGNVETSLNYIVLYLDDLNAIIDIRKSELPLQLQNNPGLKIDQTMIPDKAKVKHFIVFINE
jgi:hypothetical protein